MLFNGNNYKYNSFGIKHLKNIKSIKNVFKDHV